MNRDLKVLLGGRFDPAVPIKPHIPSWASIREKAIKTASVRVEQTAEKEAFEREQEKEQHNEGEAA